MDKSDRDFGYVLKHAKRFRCVSKDGRYIKIKKIIKFRYATGKKLLVASGVMYPQKERCIVKWYDGDDINIQHEIDIYKSLGNYAINNNDEFTLQGKKVLVMQQIDKLDHRDNVIKIAVDIIRSLKYIHTKVLHCDIKPANMGKYYENGKVRYKLFDYGRSTLIGDKRNNNSLHKRYVRTYRYVHKRYHHRSSVYVDLYETINALRIFNKDNMRKRRHSSRLKHYKYYEKKLKQCRRFLSNLPHYPTDDCYDTLVNILRHRRQK